MDLSSPGFAWRTELLTRRAAHAARRRTRVPALRKPRAQLRCRPGHDDAAPACAAAARPAHRRTPSRRGASLARRRRLRRQPGCRARRGADAGTAVGRPHLARADDHAAHCARKRGRAAADHKRRVRQLSVRRCGSPVRRAGRDMRPGRPFVFTLRLDRAQSSSGISTCPMRSAAATAASTVSTASPGDTDRSSVSTTRSSTLEHGRPMGTG